MQTDPVPHSEYLQHQAVLFFLEEVVELTMRINEIGCADTFSSLNACQRVRTIQRIVTIMAPQDKPLPPRNSPVTGKGISLLSDNKQLTIAIDGEIRIKRLLIQWSIIA
jgi:hypothetical protein